ncbi:unnamed protein product [Caenorhabditis auriculariae]|uniref:Inheritance of peroxisomes protein 1 n=1 Tax=Caenorhabditis auriculariae TaxID=2777116 RepID=A0A8S1GTR6_9PELO|nr:unnamed protein product [Caenorhabditis auriculariae]
MLSFLWKSSGTEVSDSLFSEAYACLEQGLCYDEVDDYENTLLMYERGLNLIKEAEKAKNAKKSELYNNLMEAKNSVKNRIEALKKDGPRPKQHTAKEKEANGEVNIPENKDKEALRNQLSSFGDGEAELIYFLPQGVQLFTIDGDQTTAPTPPTSLEILRLAPGDVDSSAYEMDEPSAFIQVGPWVYPLMKEKSPILRNEFGAYVVPNPTPEKPNMMVAILLPNDLDKKLIDEFDEVLRLFGNLRDQEVAKELSTEENTRLSHQIANFLVFTGQRIAWGVETTAVHIVSHVEDRGDKYRQTIEPALKPMTVSPVVKGSVVYMHKGSKVVAKCTKYLLNKVGDMGVAIGKKLADSANKTFGDGGTGGLVTGAIAIIGGGITGAGTVWMSLENGSKTLCKSIANQTVQNVKIKYGDEASETTHHALHAAGHGSLAAFQLWDLGPRSIAGRVARKAGIQIVTDLHGKRVKITEVEPISEKKKIE